LKGTSAVVEAVERLRREGVDFEFLLVENLSNAAARKLYERADLLVDQLRIGWYGGLAVELMALGKPVICYIRQEDLRYIPSAMAQDLPLIQADMTSIYSVLRYWLTEGRDRLHERGVSSRGFVERWHDPLQIAARLKHAYQAPISANRRAASPGERARRLRARQRMAAVASCRRRR
jgi:hypothetical protein